MRRFAKPKTHLPDSHRPTFTCFVCIRHCSIAAIYSHLHSIVQQAFSRFFLAQPAKLRALELCGRYCGTSWPGPIWIFPTPLHR